MTQEDGPYGLRRPTLGDARESVLRVHDSDGPAVWAALLQSAGISERQDGEHDLARLLDAMEAADPVTRLCAQALRIRVVSFDRLSAAHDLTRS